MEPLDVLCHLCRCKSKEYFNMKDDFITNIFKYLHIKIDSGIVCIECVTAIQAFDRYYQKVHNNRAAESDRQKQNLDGSELGEMMIEFTDLEPTTDKNAAEVSYIIVLDEQQHPVEGQESSMEINDALNEIPLYNEKVQDESSQDSDKKVNDTDLIMKANDCSSTTVKLNMFPTELIRDSKLIIKGKELSKLISKFYKLECELCSERKKFRKLSVMISHYKSEHSVKGYVTCCEMKIIKLRQIVLHMAKHLQPEAFICKICNKTMTCPKILQYHVQNHLPEEKRPLACLEPGCKRRFSYQSALITHNASHLPEHLRTIFHCDICQKQFHTSGRLSTHMNTAHVKHSNQQQYCCESCGRKFSCKSNFSYHLTTHKKFDFQQQCKECKKWLKNKLCLKKHMTLHSNIQHFCDLCDYSAVNKQCLSNHKKVHHSDSKVYTCEICPDRKFKLKTTLINHLATHNGIKKYFCEFCSKSFASSGNYYAHRKRMHPQELSKKLQEKEINDTKQRLEVLKNKSVTKDRNLSTMTNL